MVKAQHNELNWSDSHTLLSSRLLRGGPSGARGIRTPSRSSLRLFVRRVHADDLDAEPGQPAQHSLELGLIDEVPDEYRLLADCLDRHSLQWSDEWLAELTANHDP